MYDEILLAIGLGAFATSVGYGTYKFFKLERDKQLDVVKSWLLFAVFEAEKYLGGGTGQLKLRYVYDKFIDKFKVLSFVITFDQFNILIDNALEEMKELLTVNPSIKEYVEGTNDAEQ